MAEDYDNDGLRLVWSQGHKNLGRSKTVRGNWGRLRDILTDVFVDKAYTLQAYQQLTDVEEKTRRKNLNGFFLGGPTSDGHRSNNGIDCRTLITLDIDDMTAEQYEDWRKRNAGQLWQWEFVAVETRSSTDHKPRFRLVFPIKGRLTFDEYNAASRIVGSLLFDDETELMCAVDDVSFRFAQLMFLPTASKNQKLEVFHNRGKLLDPKKLLAQWSKKHGLDWNNHANLPYNPDRGSKAPTAPGTTVEDPFEKDGMIGAFCRAYPIEAAMDEFLPGIYEESASPSSLTRYTYTPGGGSNGAVVYEDGRYLFSNHGSDPVSEQLVNSWDLVRIHLYGEKDKDAHGNTSPTQFPSYKAMSKLVERDPVVKAEMVSAIAPKFDDIDFGDDDEDEENNAPERKKPKDTPERKKPVEDDFADILGEDPEDDDEDDIVSKFDNLGGAPEDDDEPEEPKKEDERDWKLDLQMNVKTGLLEKTRFNAAYIICKDPRIGPCIGKNEMTEAPHALKRMKIKGFDQKVPNVPEGGRMWGEADLGALAMYLSGPKTLNGWETEFNIWDIKNGILMASENRAFNPLLEQVQAVEWDGVPRIETFWSDYFGADDNIYHRETARCWFVAGVTRLYEPGHKFDSVPILEGHQGLGKSGSIELLGMGFAGELSKDFGNNQRMYELIRGKFLLEVAELSGFRLSETEDIKAFFSRTHDTTRLAYRQNEADYPRRCIFIGSSNKSEYLRDPTGNRRFWPIKCKRVGSVNFKALEAVVPQLWAEARAIYHQMRADQPKGWLPLFLQSAEARQMAVTLQAGAQEEGASEIMREAIQTFLDTPRTHDQIVGNDMFEDDDDQGQLYVRNLVSKSVIMNAMADNAVIKVHGRSDKLMGEALSRLDGFERSPNPTTRLIGDTKVKARFYQRDLTDEREWIEYSPPENDHDDDEINEMLG